MKPHLELDNDEEKEIVLKQLKNNLLEELGVYKVFVEKCNKENIADIKKMKEYAEYISLQEKTKIINNTKIENRGINYPTKEEVENYLKKNNDNILNSFIQNQSNNQNISQSQQLNNNVDQAEGGQIIE
ncbi:MAG: hypothetical protein LW595_03665 [Rickettsiales bacterium]|nr:hypothetical protein [Rickettsiales bacterium]